MDVDFNPSLKKPGQSQFPAFGGGPTDGRLGLSPLLLGLALAFTSSQMAPLYGGCVVHYRGTRTSRPRFGRCNGFLVHTAGFGPTLNLRGGRHRKIPPFDLSMVQWYTAR